ncbi:MAG: glycosyltransferase family 39 protein [Planctomycetota bacterium]
MRRLLHPAIGVFLLSLVIRVGWTRASAIELLGDFYCYERSGWHWVQTGEYLLLPWNSVPRQADRPPGYTGFVALNYLIFGRDIQAVGCVQAVLGALTSGLIVIFAARFVSRRAAVVAGLLHAFWLPAVAYVPILGSENVALPALFGTLVLIQRAESASGRARYAYLAVAGLLSGLTLLVRSITLFIAPALFLLSLRGPTTTRRRLTGAAVWAAAVVLTLMPWLVRNYLIGFGFPTFATQGPRALWWGNNPRTVDGGTGAPPTTDEEWALPEQDFQPVNREKAFQWIRENPGRYAALCATRFIRFFGTETDIWLIRYLDPRPAAQEAMGAHNWHIKEGRPATEQQIKNAKDLWARNTFRARVWQVIVAPLILVAFVLAACRPRQYVYLLLPIICYVGGMTLTAFVERYRLLSDPLLLIPLGALLSDIFAGGHDLGRLPPRWAKAAAAVTFLLASIVVRATGVDEAWYELAPIPHPAPDVSGYEFTAVPLEDQKAVRRVGSRYTDLTHTADGVRCDIGRPEQKDVTAYGGVGFPVPGFAALRLDLSFDQPENIAVVFVDGLDDTGQRVWRWVWRVRPSGHNRPTLQRETYVFVPGQPTGHFAPHGEQAAATIREVRVMIRVEPGTRAAFVLHRAEAAP